MKDYVIPFKGLKDGKHKFDLSVSKAFFSEFDNSEIIDGNLSVDVELQKKADLLEFHFVIDGSVTVECDRCLNPMEVEVYQTNELYVEFGEVASDITDVDNVLTLTFDTNEIDLKQHIYEYIILSLPYQRIHPDDEEGYSTCAPEMLDYLDQMRSNTTEDDIDPRWQKLKELKEN